MSNEIRLLNTCRTLRTNTAHEFLDEFSGTSMNATYWSNGGWTLDGVLSGGMPNVSAGVAYMGAAPPALRTASLVDQSMSKTSYRESSIAWKGGKGTVIYLLMDMADSSPNPNTGGVMLVVGFQGGNVPYATKSYLKLYVNGTQVKSKVFNTEIPVGGGGGDWYLLRLAIDGSNLIRCYCSNASIPDITYQASSYTALGGDVGFGFGTSSGALVRADWYKVSYSTAVGEIPPVMLVMSKNGLLYYESTNGNMIQVDTMLTLASDRWLSSVNHLANLYIADYGLRTKSTSGAASTSAGSSGVLTDSTADFVATDGVSALDDMLEITDGVWTSGTGKGTYLITAVTATTITISGTINIGTGTGVNYRVGRAPKVFDTDDLTLTRLTPTKGFIPPSPTIVTLFNNRLFWTGDPDNPQNGYFSAFDDPLDYLQFDDTPTSAVQYDADASQLGDHVTSAIPHGNDYLVIGGKNSIYVMRGDPGLRPQPDAQSRELGIISQSSHCYTPEQALVVMTQDGLYVLAPQQSSIPQKISRDRLPDELTNLNAEDKGVHLAYDQAREGVNIFVTPKTIGPTSHWFYGWRTKSFHRDSYPTGMEPTAVTTHTLDAVGTKQVVLGGRDGLLRVFTDDRPDDDGVNFDSFCLIGPIPLGGNGYDEGIVREVIGQLATASGNAILEIQVGDSIESAYRAAPRDAFTLLAGKNRTHSPRLRGNACFLRLSGIPGTAWANEQLSFVRERLGKQRLL